MKLFTRHPHSVNETYLEHLGFALGMAWRMAKGGAACLVHAFFPFLCEKTGSKIIREMNGMIEQGTRTQQGTPDQGLKQGPDKGE